MLCYENIKIYEHSYVVYCQVLDFTSEIAQPDILLNVHFIDQNETKVWQKEKYEILEDIIQFYYLYAFDNNPNIVKIVDFQII